MSTIVKARSAGALYLLNLILSGLTLFPTRPLPRTGEQLTATALRPGQTGTGAASSGMAARFRG